MISDSSDIRSWWLQPGTTQCGFCNAAHVEEAAIHCAICDRPLCAVCVQTLYPGRRILCPECHAQTREAAR